ncbi:dihydrolipoyl dehydrogenase [soil metagenome]
MADSSITADVVILGGGPGGYVAAIRAAQLGFNTVCVEMDKTLGGTCVNVGCIPSKALLSSSEHFEFIGQHAAEHGIGVSDVTLDLAKMLKRKDDVVGQNTKGIEFLFRKNKITWAKGFGTLKAGNVVEVRGAPPENTITSYQAKHVIIATGSVPIELPFLKFDEERILSNTGALKIPQVPKHLIVIGGGVIGLELGMVYQKFGSELTVVEATAGLLQGVDPECTAVVEKKITKNGGKIHKNAKAAGYEKQADGSVAVKVDLGGGKFDTIVTDVVLVAVGMRPNGANLGLEEIGVKVERGFVPSNEVGMTNVDGIYAIGDVTGQPMLAHKANKEGEVVAEVIAGHKAAKDWVSIPAAIFTDPEIAVAGLTEAQAKEKGIDVRVGKFPFAALGRAMAVNETEGFFKVVSDKTTNELLGVHIVGPEASNLISEGALALEMHAFLEDIGLTIHPHPTLGEGMMEAAQNGLGHAIHILNRNVG